MAFIVFNRPSLAKRTFAQIAKARPPKLLIISDGPRSGRREETLVSQCREIVQEVSWPCEVLTNFSETNLGCRLRVSSGLDWVFNQTEEAIVLEDDCYPDPTFFRFCEELLDRYRDDERVGMISGNNFQLGRCQGANESYYFSKYFHIWGWASWSNRWKSHYDVSMSKWPRVRDSGNFRALNDDQREVRYWQSIFNRVYEGKIDTWDYQWLFANWSAGRVAISPRVNLVSNLGFGADATHTTSVSSIANLATIPQSFPLKHPVGIQCNQSADEFEFRRYIYPPVGRRVLSKVLGLLRKIPPKSRELLHL